MKDKALDLEDLNCEVSWQEFHDMMLEGEPATTLPVGNPTKLKCTCSANSTMGEVDPKYHYDWCDVHLWDDGNAD